MPAHLEASDTADAAARAAKAAQQASLIRQAMQQVLQHFPAAEHSAVTCYGLPSNTCDLASAAPLHVPMCTCSSFMLPRQAAVCLCWLTRLLTALLQVDRLQGLDQLLQRLADPHADHVALVRVFQSSSSCTCTFLHVT